jgi:hypothetical protein
LHNFNGHRRSDFAAAMAAHPVGHDVQMQVVIHQDRVLVNVTLKTNIRLRPNFEFHLNQSFARSSVIVEMDFFRLVSIREAFLPKNS